MCSTVKGLARLLILQPFSEFRQEYSVIGDQTKGKDSHIIRLSEPSPKCLCRLHIYILNYYYYCVCVFFYLKAIFFCQHLMSYS